MCVQGGRWDCGLRIADCGLKTSRVRISTVTSDSPLAAELRARIAGGGAIPFREFMAAALYHPQHGYYASGRAAIGRKGDFFTNVSVGPLFGRLLARQFAEIWQRLGEPGEFTIVEQGAHGGDFAGDVLAGLREFAPACFAAAAYQIVEPGTLLRETQAAKLAAFGGKVRWSPVLEPFSGVHFSNELIDALPVHAVTWTGEEWRERHVGLHDDRFVFTGGPLSSEALRSHLAQLPPVPPGYETEVNLAALDWIADIATKLERGCVLAIDYGFPRAEYYRADRTGGTLTGYAHHRRETDLLARPGEIDLTAHVDFTSLAERGERCGLRPAGFTDQHHFMVGLGRLHFPDGTAPDAQEMRAFKTLMHPTLMGLSFKVLCLEKGLAGSAPLAGFHFASSPPRVGGPSQGRSPERD